MGLAAIIATAAVILFLIGFIASGFHRGFLRVILSAFSLAITLVLVGAFAEPVADYFENRTVVGPRLENSIETFVDDQLEGISTGVADSETALIESLPLTASMKEELLAGNTMAGYADQGVKTFAEYVASRLTTLLIRLLTYVLLFILIFLILKLILRLSNLINHIPLVGGINRIAGAIVGFAEGVLFLWIISMIIMMLSGTEFGISCQNVIEESAVLRFIYGNNYLMEIVNQIGGLFTLS